MLYYLFTKSGKISAKKGVGLYYVMGIYYVFYGTLFSVLGIPRLPAAPSIEGAALSIERVPFYIMALLLGIPRWRIAIYR